MTGYSYTYSDELMNKLTDGWVRVHEFQLKPIVIPHEVNDVVAILPNNEPYYRKFEKKCRRK